ncbi:MAG: hypothetical protein ACM3N6_13660, partial [Betaproteobacteria bacterium]
MTTAQYVGRQSPARRRGRRQDPASCATGEHNRAAPCDARHDFMPTAAPSAPARRVPRALGVASLVAALAAA